VTGRDGGAATANGMTVSPVPAGLLTCEDLVAGYGEMAVCRGITLQVRRGEVVALLGPNGAGKTTLLMTLAGTLRPLGGRVTFAGETLRATGPEKRVAAGMGVVPQERSVFFGLTVRDNIRLGRGPLEGVLAMFPELEPHLDRRAGLLSGGQQQMLALGRVMAAHPALLLVDELSLGLAPRAVDRLLAAVRDAAVRGVGVLLVEQQIAKAIAVSDRYLVLRRGQIVLTGMSRDLKGDAEPIRRAYLS
jgi:branched-chain amino acid transport system ATP-binding protein